ncbi:DUF7824 domain-containing protein [Paractinoplanes lichenicola]|uniref:DUF7824 domain-containing protein n=1 Tax=Paractinoplanes lichenicola TaxID=2802976 RepID=A0ABS1VUH1_9ACTN|nr:DUF6493 family protein [Actinoplanes lichenicola]MBL7258105.1 hypothetical protein [Actinoplanes lichenicola]
MKLTWDALRYKPWRGGLEGLTTLLVEAGEPERLAFGKEFEARFKALKGDEWWRVQPGTFGAYGLAALGTMPSAARTAAILGRRTMRDQWRHIPVPLALRVVRARELPWLGDLAGRLAAKLNPSDAYNESWPLLSALLLESETAPPVSEAVVRSWVFNVVHSGRLRDDPHLDLLLPAVFEIDGLGGELTVNSWDPGKRDGFADAVVRLTAEGRLERKVVLAATLDRLVRGDRPGFLRPFGALHDMLAPTVDELASHALDYAQLLPGAPSAVAGIAQRALRAVDDAGRLELDTLLDVSRPTLVRKEKTLVKTQLTWLDKVARREPGRVAEILETVGAAFDHPALDVQERALALVEKRSRGLDLVWLPSAAAGLGGDLPARAARLSPAPATGLGRPPLPGSALAPPPGPALLPPAIGSVAELAEEVAAILRDPTALRWEWVLAGLVTLRTAEDLSPLRHLLDREDDSLHNPRQAALGVLIRSILEPARGHLLETDRTWLETLSALRDHAVRGSLRPGLGGAPTKLLTLRIAEVASESPVPLLMATPTHVNGSLEPSILVERLRRAEAEGWQPLPLDLEQALLRLPRGTTPAVAEGLTSPDGRRLTDWLAAGGLPDPVSSRHEQAAPRQGPRRYGKQPEFGRLVVDLDPVRAGVLTVEEQLVTLSRSATVAEHVWVTAPTVLAATLPHHREVCAAWALPGLAALADRDQRAGSTVLPLLAENDGPFGPAMSLAVAYVLAARHELDRAAAVDAFVTLAARATSAVDEAGVETGGFGASVGRDLARLTTGGMIKLSRAVLSLADAHRGGASAAVWEVVAAALPPLLPAAPRGLPGLLELASLVAAATGARGEIPGLAEVAARPGSTSLLRESRRLRSVLGA